MDDLHSIHYQQDFGVCFCSESTDFLLNLPPISFHIHLNNSYILQSAQTLLKLNIRYKRRTF